MILNSTDQGPNVLGTPLIAGKNECESWMKSYMDSTIAESVMIL